MISYLITKNNKFFYEGECGVYASGLYNILIRMAADRKSIYHTNKFILRQSSKNT